MLLEAEGQPCAHDVSDREQHQGLLLVDPNVMVLCSFPYLSTLLDHSSIKYIFTVLQHKHGQVTMSTRHQVRAGLISRLALTAFLHAVNEIKTEILELSAFIA